MRQWFLTCDTERKKGGAPKAKIAILEFTKMKNFCAAKDTIKKWQRQPTNGRRCLQIIYLVRDLYKEHLQLNNNEINNPIFNWANDFNRNCSGEDMQNGQ